MYVLCGIFILFLSKGYKINQLKRLANRLAECFLYLLTEVTLKCLLVLGFTFLKWCKDKCDRIKLSKTKNVLYEQRTSDFLYPVLA